MAKQIIQPHKGPVVSVRAFVTNEQGKILILKRSKSNYATGKWCLPGGNVKYGDSPEESIIREMKEETSLKYENVRFIYYQNSPPPEKGLMHCLNIYFIGNASGKVRLDEESSDFMWVTPDEAKKYNLVFGADKVIDIYKGVKFGIERELELLSEAAEAGIVITRKRLSQINPQPGFFYKLRDDLNIYEQVRKRVHANLELIQSRHMRQGESIVSAISSRTKSPPSILEKMIRKADDAVPRHYTTFDDLAGARMVVSFLEDLDTVLDDIQTWGEFAIREIDNKVKRPGSSGYRGMHVTIEVPIAKIGFVPRCEIQIRTAYQDSWAIKAHVLTYKQNNIPTRYHNELLHLSEALAQADKVSDRLRKKIERFKEKKKTV